MLNIDKIKNAFSDVIGNTHIKTQLSVSMAAAKIQNKSLPHVLFAGAAGCGKTTMSRLVSTAMETPFISAAPGALKDETSIRKEIVTKLPWNGYDAKGNIVGKIRPAIVFIDEIHGISLKGQELLGIMMENWLFPSKTSSSGMSPVPMFTLIGATTLEGTISKPMRDRFKLVCRFTTYSFTESIEIAKNYVTSMGLTIDEEGATSVAARSRGVPRYIIRYLDWLRDYSVLLGVKDLNAKIAEEAFSLMRVDKSGLTDVDIKILKCLSQSEKPVGIDTLVILTNETAKTIEQAVEPYLIQSGLIQRTPQGRIITPTGRNYLEQQGLLEPERLYLAEEV